MLAGNFSCCQQQAGGQLLLQLSVGVPTELASCLLFCQLAAVWLQMHATTMGTSTV
jgi:hypothetical protein